MTCRWDRDTKRHLLRSHQPDCTRVLCRGCLPCTHDDTGTPVRHCRTRTRCASHLTWDQHTCPRCVTKIRADLTAVVDEAALAELEALERGVDSEAANLAGPHADAVTVSWRLINAARAGEVVEELDMLDPYTCLTAHERWIREDLGHDAVTLVSETLARSADYLAWVLTDLARDEDRTYLLAGLLSDLARLRGHMEASRGDSRTPTQGAPCRSCGDAAPRLRLTRGHWCDDADCRREHHVDDTGDRWVCPRDRSHWWTTEDYRRWVYADAHDSRVSQ